MMEPVLWQHITEAGKSGKVWTATILRAGMSLNGNYYPADRLEEWASLF